MAVSCITMWVLAPSMSVCLSKLRFYLEYSLLQSSHIAAAGQQFVHHLGFFSIAQSGIVSLLVVKAIGSVVLFGQGSADEAVVDGDV